MGLKGIAKKPYHALPVDDVFTHIRSSRQGLSDFDALGRLQAYGPNALPEGEQFSWIKILWKQLANPLIGIIMAAATASFFLGHHVDAFFIVIVIVINALVGFFQEYKAETALRALRNTITPHAQVIRGGTQKIIDASQIVVGDVVVLHAGDKIPADGRLFHVEELFVNESVLTGEWVDVHKTIQPSERKVGLGGQHAMAFAGAHVTNGEGKYVVTAIAGDTEIGKIAQMVRDEDDIEEPLKKKFTRLSQQGGFAILLLIAVFAFFGILRGQTVADIFVTSTALVVSAIPEGLLPAVTIIMIFGVRRLVRKKALVRRLSSTETIGAITVICTDKTGTLTEGKMGVSHVLTGAQELLTHTVQRDDAGQLPRLSTGHLRALEIGGIVNDAFIENPNEELAQWTVQGRPTDRALLLAAVQAGIDVPSMIAHKKRVGHVPFTSARKFAAHIYADTQEKTATLLALGAPERIFERATMVHIGDDVDVALSARVRAELEEHVNRLTGQGLRVVACAERRIATQDVPEERQEQLVTELTIIGFIAIKDPVRADAKEAIERAQRAGIRPLIITGDHAQTAAAIVSELGWYVSSEHICTGAEVELMSDEQLQSAVQKIALFARVDPRHKIRIVHALQANNEVVAMVGDGVNDAPALKAAHVGISMGNGTDITKGVADMVLLDSSFTTIIDAVEQGRVIFDNIRRTITYLLADDFSELFLFFIALIFGLPMPLVAAQILWINLVEDSLPNIALTTERDTKGIMEIPPRKADEPIIAASYRTFMHVIFLVSGIAAVALFVGIWYMTQNLALTQTMTFTLVALDSLAMVYVLRSFRRSMFRRDLFDNHMINGAVITSLFLLVAAVSFEPLMGILHTTSLDAIHWGIISCIVLIEMILLEGAKHFLFAQQKTVVR